MELLDLIKAAFEYGVLGVSVLVLAFVVRKLYSDAREGDKEHQEHLAKLNSKLSQEQAARVEDAKRFTEVALKLQAEVISSVTSIEKASSENAKLCEFVHQLVDAVQEERLRERERLRDRPQLPPRR